MKTRAPGLALLLMLGPALLPAQAAGTIYRCHALNGALLFQDRPCNTVASTREAQAGHEGEVVAVEPPSSPQEPVTPAVERYRSYLDLVAKDRREQQAADDAAAARLRAAAEADRAASAVSQAAQPTVYEPPYAVFLPAPRPPIYRGPYPAQNPPTPAPAPGTPTRPPRRDARSEILSFDPAQH